MEVPAVSGNLLAIQSDAQIDSWNIGKLHEEGQVGFFQSACEAINLACSVHMFGCMKETTALQ